MEMNTIPKILMVDDDVDLSSIMSIKLQAEGFAIKTVNDPVAALEAARQYVPDLILLDINMPGMNGTEYLIDLRQLPETKKAKVIFFTSMSNPWPVFRDPAAIAKELGAVDFLEKSADLSEVVKKIKEALLKG